MGVRTPGETSSEDCFCGDKLMRFVQLEFHAVGSTVATSSSAPSRRLNISRVDVARVDVIRPVAVDASHDRSRLRVE